jgi:hypothetical protein
MNFLFWKKVKSPLSMNFGRISTSKCRGKLQKMGVLYTYSPKSPGPSPKLPKFHFKLFFFNSKKLGQLDMRRCRLTAGGRLAVTHSPQVDAYTCHVVSIFLEIFFLHAQVVNSLSLAAAHARPAHTSP